MPIARFQLPDGRIARFEVPEGTTPEQAQSLIQSQLPSFGLATAPTTAPKQSERTVMGSLGDTAVTGFKSAVGLVQAGLGLADIPANLLGLYAPSKTLAGLGLRPDEAQKLLDKMYSPAQQEAEKEVKEAEGFIDTLSALGRRPSVIATTGGQALGQMLGGMGIARGAMALAPKIAPMVAGAIGEGTLGAGSAMQQISEATGDVQPTPGQAGLAMLSGAGTAGLGILGARAAKALGGTDIDTMLAQGARRAATEGAETVGKTVTKVPGGTREVVVKPPGFLSQMARSGLSEGVFEELPQSVQEQMVQNYALDKPLLEGVGKAAAMGLTVGTAMGVAGGGYSALGARGERPAAPPTGEVPPTAPAVPPTGEAPSVPPTVAPEIQEVRDRLASRGFSEEDIDRILAERAMREAPAAVKEPTDVTAATPPANVPATTELEPGVGESGVGVPSGDLGRPTTVEPAAPVGLGLERPVVSPAPRVEPETTIPTELTETPSGTQAPQAVKAKEEGPAQPAAPAPTAVEAPATTPPVEEKPARYQRLRAEQPWYSALSKAIEESPQKAAPAPQWKNVLTGMVNKGQAKRDEIEWTGVEDWLALQQGRVTKEQIQDYLKQGGVRVEEAVLGGNQFKAIKDGYIAAMIRQGKSPDAAALLWEEMQAFAQNEEDYNEKWKDEGFDLVMRDGMYTGNEIHDAIDGTYETKYSQYTLPGGQNYREVLLTLPEKSYEDVERELGYDSNNLTPEQEEEVWVRVNRTAPKAYRSSHWDQPNVLAHIRVNDRTDADGKKVLFVEEIQSDWGQEGKKKGFAGKQSAEKVYQDYLEALQSRVADDVKRTMMSEGVAEEKATALGQKMAARMAQDPRKLAEYLGESDKQMALNEARIKERSAVPTAPFVTKTEGWLNLALKRVLTMAAEGGYDRVAFTTGEQNADRYDLSKQVDELMIEKDGNNYMIAMKPVGQGYGEGSRWSGKAQELPDVVGKDLADKIAAQPEGRSYMRGLDLKVGGEGMKTFYDQIIPNALKKLLPKVGSGQIGQVNLLKDSMRNYDSQIMKDDLERLGENGFRAKYAHNEQPGFDITPAMREKLAAGLPLFQKEGEEQPPQKTGKYPLPAEAIEALKDNSLTMALDAIENSKPSEINKAIAARVKMLLKNTQVTIDDDLRDSKGNPVLGAASTSGSRIWLDANRGMNMETVLHESVHAATERILSTPEDQRTPEQNAAVQELTDLWNAAKANSDIKLTPEASDSLSEFVAEGMTNIELQDQLASVKWESKTMWQGFKRILLNMLGIKTPASMLDYTLASVDTIFAAVPKAAAPISTPAQTTTKPKAKQTETKAFKDWFGDSKVVDENGEPLVVYHGSPVRDFTVFDINKINANDPDGPFNGFFFSSSKQDADSAGRFPWGRPNAESPQTRAFYLSIKNPATKKQARAISREIEDAYFNGAYPNARSLQDATREELEKRGYDGIVFEPYVSPSREAFERDGRVKLGKNGGELVRTEEGYVDLYERGEQITGYADFDEALNSLKHGIFIAFRPEQIKSATGNIGTFDVTSPDIRYQKPKLTADEKAKKEAEEADAKVKEAQEKFAQSKSSEEAAKAAFTLQSLRSSKTAIPQLQRLYDSVSDKGKRILVRALGSDVLAEWASKNVPELQRTADLLSRMNGMTQQLLHGASQTSDRISRAFNKDRLLRDRLERVVYVSTLAQIDPSTNKVSSELNTLYKALGEEGQAIYKEVRDYYTDMGDLYSQLIQTNVERSEASEESKAAILAKLKVMFEPANRMRPYFPLMREGNYWFSSGKGKNRRFHMFETMPERDAALEALARSEGKSLQDMKETSEVKFGNNVASLREISKDTDKSLTEVLTLIDKLDTGSAESKKNLLDSVYQMYLHSLPEQSFRKHYITREGTAGFRIDFLRNFSQSAIQMSGQLARVKYGSQIRASLSGAKASIENQPQYEPFVEEMTKRAELDLVPPARTTLDAVGDVLTKVTYVHYLSSISSALMQPVGILQTGIAVLGGRHGFVKSAAEIAKLSMVWDSFSMTRKLPDGSTTTVFPTVANSKAVTPPKGASVEQIERARLEKQAINEMLARDVSQSTMARELYGYRAKPTDRINTAGDKGAKAANLLLGGLMHHTERISREIIFLASYRLNIKEGKSHEAAVDAAVKDTKDSLGNYSQYDRPRFMRNPIGKVALQFSTYSLHIASFLGSNFYKMIPFLNKEGKAEAAKIFFGTMGTTWILAGAAGFPAPISAVLMGFISFMFSLLGDDDEMPDELRKRNFNAWFNEIWLPSQLGHIEVFGHKLSDVVKTGPANMAGWDLASRTSLNNLFLREQKETKTPRDSITAMVMEKAGPSINMILSYADGAQAFKEGDYQRAVEKIAPAAIRSIAQTYRFATEGAKDIKGNELITQGDFTTGELLGRAIGFQPSRLSNLQKVNAEINQDKAQMDNARNLILRKFDIAERKNADVVPIIEEINEYNAKYPSNAISGSDVAKYLKNKAKERAESQKGVSITKTTPTDILEMIQLSRNYGISKKEESTSTPDYGLRVDGTPKAQGFFGELKRPDGDVSTELSIGVNIGGKEMEIPAIVPTLTKKELNFLLSDGPSSDPIMQSIEDKAIEHAKKRIKAGLSPFATPNERVLPTPK